MTSKRIILVFGIIMDLITRPLNAVSVPVEMCRLDTVLLAHLMLSGSSILCAGFIASTQLTADSNVVLHNRYIEVCCKSPL